MKKIIFVIVIMFVLNATAVFSAPASGGVSIKIGEKHSYFIKWLGVNVGQLDVIVRDDTTLNGRPVYVIEMTGGTNKFCSMIYRIQDRFVSYVDKERLVPLKLEVSRREGFYKKDAVTIFDHEKGTAYFHNYLDKSSKEYAIPADVQDIVSVFFRLRYDTVTLNQQMTYHVAFAETVFDAYGAAETRNDYEIAKGRLIPAYFTRPRAKVGDKEVKEGTVSAFFSADDYKIPLHVTLKAPLFTQVTMTLSEATSLSA